MSKIKTPDYPNRRYEVRLGRNFVRKGDLVKVRPPDGSNRYWARFQWVDVDGGGEYACVFMLERGDKGALVYCGVRHVKLDRIDRTATTNDPLKQAEARAEARKEKR